MPLLFFIFILGLVLGSFVNALIFRLPRGLSLLGRSFCPKCQKQIYWFDNIPLFSFLRLQGFCRSCHQKISVKYPLVEAVSAAGGVALFVFEPDFFLFATRYLLFLILLAIFIIDIEHQLIPDELIFSGLAVSVFSFKSSIFSLLLPGFLAASALLLLHFATRGRGMGLGDVKLAVLGGALVGPNLMLIWLFLAFLTGAIASVILIALKKKSLKDKIAFGPFLILAILLSLVYEVFQ